MSDANNNVMQENRASDRWNRVGNCNQLVANVTKNSSLATKLFTLVTYGRPTSSKHVSACFSHFLEWFLYDCRITKAKDNMQANLSAQWSKPGNAILSLLKSTSQWNLEFRELGQSDWSTGVALAVLTESIARLLFSALNYWMGLNEFTGHVGLNKQDQVEQKPMLCVSQKTGQISRTRKPHWLYQCSASVHRPWIRVREIMLF